MKLSFQTIFLFSLLFLCTHQESKSLKFNGETITNSNENVSGPVTFKISMSKNPTYLKISVKGKETGDQSDMKRIISYHQNENNINEREQLSLSDTETTTMYLKKEQLKSEFYLTVQCEKTPCSYDLILESKEYAELNLTESFSYYVTEPNKQMKFKITGTPETTSKSEEVTNKTITIYVIGNLEVNIELESEYSYIKDKELNVYLIKISELNKLYEFILTINGKPGDFIYVGSNFFDGSEYSVSQKVLKFSEFYTFGILQKGVKSENCYKTESSSYTFNSGSFRDPNIKVRPYNKYIDNVHFLCMSFSELVESDDGDEIVYYLRIYSKNSKTISALEPFIIQGRSSYEVNQGTTQGFYYQIGDNNNIYNYDLYSAINIIFEVSYSECDSFPFCELNENIIKNAKKIQTVNSFSNLALNKKNYKIIQR